MWADRREQADDRHAARRRARNKSWSDVPPAFGSRCRQLDCPGWIAQAGLPKAGLPKAGLPKAEWKSYLELASFQPARCQEAARRRFERRVDEEGLVWAAVGGRPAPLVELIVSLRRKQPPPGHIFEGLGGMYFEEEGGTAEQVAMDLELFRPSCDRRSGRSRHRRINEENSPSAVIHQRSAVGMVDPAVYFLSAARRWVSQHGRIRSLR